MDDLILEQQKKDEEYNQLIEDYDKLLEDKITII